MSEKYLFNINSGSRVWSYVHHNPTNKGSYDHLTLNGPCSYVLASDLQNIFTVILRQSLIICVKFVTRFTEKV